MMKTSVIGSGLRYNEKAKVPDAQTDRPGQAPAGEGCAWRLTLTGHFDSRALQGLLVSCALPYLRFHDAAQTRAATMFCNFWSINPNDSSANLSYCTVNVVASGSPNRPSLSLAWAKIV